MTASRSSPDRFRRCRRRGRPWSRPSRRARRTPRSRTSSRSCARRSRAAKTRRRPTMMWCARSSPGARTRGRRRRGAPARSSSTPARDLSFDPWTPTRRLHVSGAAAPKTKARPGAWHQRRRFRDSFAPKRGSSAARGRRCGVGDSATGLDAFAPPPPRASRSTASLSRSAATAAKAALAAASASPFIAATRQWWLAAASGWSGSASCAAKRSSSKLFPRWAGIIAIDSSTSFPAIQSAHP